MEAVGRKLTIISNPFDSNSYDDLTMMMLDHYNGEILCDSNKRERENMIHTKIEWL